MNGDGQIVKYDFKGVSIVWEISPDKYLIMKNIACLQNGILRLLFPNLNELSILFDNLLIWNKIGPFLICRK